MRWRKATEAMPTLLAHAACTGSTQRADSRREDAARDLNLLPLTQTENLWVSHLLGNGDVWG